MYGEENCDMTAVAAQQAKYMAPGGNAATQRPSRTFDQLDQAVAELQELNKRLTSALDRLGHERCDEKCDNAAISAANRIGPDYGRALNRLMREISELRSNISSLETHV